MNNFGLVVSSPSGVGKSTLCRMLLSKYKEIGTSISVTTRQPRINETNGVDYHFFSKEQFEVLASKGEFLEHAQVYGNYYGTWQPEVVKILESGKNILFDIDFQGAEQLRQNVKGFHICYVYLFPPSVQVVYNRLKNRETDSADVIEYRMKSFYESMKHYDEYDYVIINDDINIAFQELCSVYEATKVKVATQTTIPNIFNELMHEKYSR